MSGLTVTPAHPVADRECKLTFTPGAGGNQVRVWCTAAPPESKLREQLDKSGATQIAVYNADASQAVPFVADQGGAYVFLVEEISRGASVHGGVYDGDPNKAPSETIVDTSQVTLFFASALTCSLGAGNDTAELLVHVLNEGIIRTTAELHGVVSPALRNPKTGLAKVAVESAVVRSAVAALVGSASGKLGDVAAWLNSLLDAFNAHLSQAGVHAHDDEDNVITTGFRNATTTEGQKRSVAAIRKALDNHMRNDIQHADPEVDPPRYPGTGTGDYHDSPDWGNALLSVAPGDQLSALVSAADAWRAFEAHRVSDVHEVHDTVNAAATPPPLIALHVAFLRQLATQTPDTPANEHPGKALLLSAGGFKEI